MQVLENNLWSKDVVDIKSTHYCSTKTHIDTKALDKRWRGYTGDDNIRKTVWSWEVPEKSITHTDAKGTVTATVFFDKNPPWGIVSLRCVGALEPFPHERSSKTCVKFTITQHKNRRTWLSLERAHLKAQGLYVFKKQNKTHKWCLFIYWGSTCACKRMGACLCLVWRSETTCGCQFSSSITWVSGLKLRSWWQVTRSPPLAISPALTMACGGRNWDD